MKTGKKPGWKELNRIKEVKGNIKTGNRLIEGKKEVRKKKAHESKGKWQSKHN